MKFYKQLRKELVQKIRSDFNYNKYDCIEKDLVKDYTQTDLESLVSQIELLKWSIREITGKLEDTLFVENSYSLICLDFDIPYEVSKDLVMWLGIVFRNNKNLDITYSDMYNVLVDTINNLVPKLKENDYNLLYKALIRTAFLNYHKDDVEYIENMLCEI